MKKIIIFTLVLILTMTQSYAIVIADSISSENISSDNFAQDMRLLSFLENEVDRLFGEQAEIDIVKDLTDFDGNKYTLIECQSKGYLIFHNNSFNIIEYSPNSISPYIGYNQGLFYSGPTYYYVWENDTLHHTVIEESHGIEMIEAFTKLSQANHQEYMKNLDLSVKNYIETGGELPLQSTYSTQALTRIEGADYISALNTPAEMGYMPNNYCGYIAAGMLLLYYDILENDNIINDSLYLNSQGRAFKGSSFTSLLHSFSGSSSSESTAADIKVAIDEYLATRGLSVSESTSVLPVTANIKQALDQDHPVILFGSLRRPDDTTYPYERIAHAVLVYGYDGNSLLAHYGWEDYQDVYIVGTWGSSYHIISGFEAAS